MHGGILQVGVYNSPVVGDRYDLTAVLAQFSASRYEDARDHAHEWLMIAARVYPVLRRWGLEAER